MGRHHKSSSSKSISKKKHRKHKVKKEHIKKEEPKQEEPKQEAQIIKELPNFEPSGILAKYAENALANGKVLKFTIPLDGKEPNDSWSIFPFKGKEAFPSILLKGKSAFLIGKDFEISDIVVENPTVSKQHCVIQFREVRKVSQNGIIQSVIKPYAMDLESTNGTFLNEKQLEPARYYELLDSDVLKFGKSEREFVLIKS